MRINWKKAYGLLIILFILAARFDPLLACWEWMVIWFSPKCNKKSLYGRARSSQGLFLGVHKRRRKNMSEYEKLDSKWIDEHAKAVAYDGMPDQTEVVYVDDLKNLLVPKQEEVDRAYKDGYEKGKEHATRDDEPETVADVVTAFLKSYERLEEVMSVEVEELEEDAKD